MEKHFMASSVRTRFDSVHAARRIALLGAWFVLIVHPLLGTEEGHGTNTWPWDETEASARVLDHTVAAGLYDLCSAWSVAFADVNGDNAPDLYVANHIHYPSRLYLNRGDGTFTDHTEASGIREGMDDHDGAFGDFDNDGDPDLAVTNGYYRPDRFFRNEGGGRFTDASEAVGYILGNQGRGRNAAFMDFDRDGHLDVLVTNCLGHNLLYWNDGKGGFTPDTHGARLDSRYRHMGSAVGDLDGDGLTDIVLGGTGPGQPVQFFKNLGGRLFDERAEAAGIRPDRPTGAVALGDYDNDGDLDLFLGSDSAKQGGFLYRNEGDGSFRDVTRQARLEPTNGRCPCALFLDLDNDGDLDLYVVNSGDRKTGPDGWNHLCRNRGDGTFGAWIDRNDLANRGPGNGSAAAAADVDGDGWLDVVTVGGAYSIEPQGPLLLHPGRPVEGMHYLRLDLVGSRSNRDGKGARIWLHAGGGLQYRQAGVRGSYSQDEATIHFGLGRSERADRIVIHWPSGIVQVLHDVPGDRRFTVLEPKRHQWFGDDAGILAIRGRTSRAADMAIRSMSGLVDEEVLSRQQELLEAWSGDAAAQVPGTGGRGPKYGAERSGPITVPAMRWVEQVALGRLTRLVDREKDHDGLRSERQAVEEAQRREDILRIAERFRQGDKARELALAVKVRAWRKASVWQGEVEHFGYLNRGYFTRRMLEDRFGGETAEVLWHARQGEVVGPLTGIERFDVQPLEDRIPLHRVFRIGPRRTARTLVPGKTSPRVGVREEKMRSSDVERARAAEALAQALMERLMAGHRRSEKALRRAYRERMEDFTRAPRSGRAAGDHPLADGWRTLRDPSRNGR